MKKTLSLLLALVMLLSMIPMAASAAEPYVISAVELKEGSNSVKMESGADYTLFEFTADSAATYTFSAPSGVKLVNYGSSFFPQNITVNSGETPTNTLDITFTAEGISQLVGVYNAQSSTTVKVTQGAAYQPLVVNTLEYKNKASLSKFSVPANATIGSYIDVYSSTNHKAVKGSDGYYHLDSASGDILLVDMDYLHTLSAVLASDRPVMYVYEPKVGNTQTRWDISSAVVAYEAVCDKNGYYPLTEDLIYFYKDYATGVALYSYVLGSGYNENNAWMFACLTMNIPSSKPTEPEPSEPAPSEPQKPATKLDAPVATASNVASSGKIKISWNAVSGAAKYEVYRASSANGSYSLRTTTTETSYTNTSVEVGKTYYYYVKAIAADGTTAKSETVSRICKLARPEVTLSNRASDGKIVVKWSAVDGAAKYQIYRASSKNGTYSLKYTTSGTSYVNSGATTGKTYYYKVVAVASNTSANSAASSVKSRTVDLAQTTVKVSNRASDGKITISWDAVDGATKYQVYRATSKDGTYTRITTTKNTSVTNTSAVAGKTYYYKVRAICDVDAAAAAYSSVKSRTCDLPQPDVSITRSSGKPKVSWDKISGATSYKIYRATSKNGTYSLVKTVTGTSWKDTTAKKNKTYYYKVMAVCKNSAGNSAYSKVVSIKATK